MLYDKEYTALFGKKAINRLLKAVDDGEVNVHQADKLAFRLDPSVGEEFKQDRNEKHFKWSRRAMKKILSNHYYFISPKSEEDNQRERIRLLSCLKAWDVGLGALAEDVACF